MYEHCLVVEIFQPVGMSYYDIDAILTDAEVWITLLPSALLSTTVACLLRLVVVLRRLNIFCPRSCSKPPTSCIAFCSSPNVFSLKKSVGYQIDKQRTIQKVPGTFELDVPGLGFLDNNAGADVCLLPESPSH